MSYLKENMETDTDLYLDDSIKKSHAFCTMNNFGSAIRHLSQELQNLGLNYTLIEKSGDKLNLVSLVNGCWELIQLYQSALKDGNAMHDKRRRELADLNFLHGSVRDLRSLLEEKDRQIQDLSLKERQNQSINQTLAAKLKSEKEEVRRFSYIIQQRDSHHLHELKKKELENNKLIERLHRLISGERGSESRLSMTGSLPRSDRARSRWKTDTVKHEDELHHKVLSQYESWINQLTDEGDQLKQCLASVSGKLSKIASRFAKLQEENMESSTMNLSETPENEIFSLNFGPNRKRIEDHLQNNLNTLTTALENINSGNKSGISESVVSTDELADLSESQFSEPCESSFENRLAFLAESQFVEKEHEIKQQLKLLKEEKTKLQREREAFAIAAVRLNKEKMEFEAEKVELLRCQFLNDLPQSLMDQTESTEEISRNVADLCGDSPKILQSIPTISSPFVNLRKTSQPVTLGHVKSPLRDDRMKCTPSRIPVRSPGSAPSTRNSSVSRCDSADLDSPRSKTLERPQQRSRSHQMHRSLPLNESPFNTLRSPVRPSVSPRKFLDQRVLLPGRPLSTDHHPLEDTTSVDSGCYLDAMTFNPRDVATNHRLDALETSLVLLLDQVQSRSERADANQYDQKERCNQGDSDVSRRSPFCDLAPEKESLTAEFEPVSTSTTLRSPERPLKVVTGDEYLKKIQSNFAKWYSK